jgi:dihydrofolate reductase
MPGRVRDVILFATTSVDGFIAGTDGAPVWSGAEDGGARWPTPVGGLLVGRGQFERMLASGAWPHAGTPTYLFTRRTPAKLPPRVTAVAADPARFVAGLKRLAGEPLLLLGGCGLSTALMAAGLVDEVVVSVRPVWLRAGTPMVRLAGAVRLELQGCGELPSGVRRYRYRVQQACRPGGRSAGRSAGRASRTRGGDPLPERLRGGRRASKAAPG